MMRTLKDLVESNRFAVDVHGVPFLVHRVSYQDALESFGEETAAIIVSQYFGVASVGDIPDEQAAQKVMEDHPKMILAMMDFERRVLRLGCINPRIAQGDEPEVLEPPDGQVAVVRFGSLSDADIKLLRESILGGARTGKGDGS